jgi:valyl-tRNA synthetase
MHYYFFNGDVGVPKAATVFQVDNPHFTVRLYEDLLRIDLKGSLKSEIEEALENKPVLKETLGSILGIFVPLHIHVSEISSVRMNETGKIEVSLHHHRNIVIPIERKEDAEKLVEKLSQAISNVRTAKIKERLATRRAKKRPKKKSRGSPPSSYGTVPYYFPTEQTDIVDKLNRRRKKLRK